EGAPLALVEQPEAVQRLQERRERPREEALEVLTHAAQEPTQNAGHADTPRTDTKTPAALLGDHPLGIPRRFPQVPVRVLEVARVTTPEGVVRRLHDNCTRAFGLFHYRIDLVLRGDVVPDGELGRAGAAGSEPRIVSNALSRPEREFQAALQVEESDRAILELGADNAFGLQAQTVPVEPDRPLEIVNAKSDERDSR